MNLQHLAPQDSLELQNERLMKPWNSQQQLHIANEVHWTGSTTLLSKLWATQAKDNLKA
jgi:hypothetical protein